MNAKQYQMIGVIEAQRAEGKNKINVYSCLGCARQTITIDRDSGVTPFNISCPSCGKTAMSAIYRVSQDLTPTHEFYRPSFAYYQNIPSREMRRHIENGGLMFRKLGNLK